MHLGSSLTACALAVAAMIPLSQAAPSGVQIMPPSKVNLAPRGATTTMCDKDPVATASNFLLYNNLWGQDSDPSGKQCTVLDYSSPGVISWHTQWTWTQAPDAVKSYANAVLNIEPIQLSAIKGLPTTWHWNYTGQGLYGDVAYDAFFSKQATKEKPHDYEVMVWLASFNGAKPIGQQVQLAQPLTIGGVVFDLWHGRGEPGTNPWEVFSFVARTETRQFSADLNQFFKFLTKTQGVPANYFLQTVGAGTEPFTGSNAVFTVSPYTMSLNK